MDQNSKFIKNKETTKVNDVDPINDNGDGNGNAVGALSKNDVDVEIEPDSKNNQVYINFCSCMLNLSCFNSTSDK
jgi:hypothetical protein